MDAWRERASSAAASASPGLPCASFRAGPGPPRSGRVAHGLGRLRSGFFYLRAGTPTWSQDVDLAANDPITRHTNVAYTLHFYAGTHEQRLRERRRAPCRQRAAGRQPQLSPALGGVRGRQQQRRGPGSSLTIDLLRQKSREM
ncbi:cellulase family glycosylhydrolase [Sorangium sp. So ce119]|uniref:cellulase family glycosylhydrolase n=1 Tax=Sorangium sp. So ce119 TaxID=3133279 RepID=UPI003F5E473F